MAGTFARDHPDLARFRVTPANTFAVGAEAGDMLMSTQPSKLSATIDGHSTRSGPPLLFLGAPRQLCRGPWHASLQRRLIVRLSEYLLVNAPIVAGVQKALQHFTVWIDIETVLLEPCSIEVGRRVSITTVADQADKRPLPFVPEHIRRNKAEAKKVCSCRAADLPEKAIGQHVHGRKRCCVGYPDHVIDD